MRGTRGGGGACGSRVKHFPRSKEGKQGTRRKVEIERERERERERENKTLNPKPLNPKPLNRERQKTSKLRSKAGERERVRAALP